MSSVRKLRPTPDGLGASCRTIVVAQKSAEALTATNRTEGTSITRGVDKVVADPLMVPFTVVVGLELGKRTMEVPLSERDEVVEAFLFDGTDEALRVCAAVRRPERYPHDPHASRFEDASDSGTPLAVTVADQKSLFLQHTVGICHLPRNLNHECFVRMRRAGDDLDPVVRQNWIQPKPQEF